MRVRDKNGIEFEIRMRYQSQNILIWVKGKWSKLIDTRHWGKEWKFECWNKAKGCWYSWALDWWMGEK